MGKELADPDWPPLTAAEVRSVLAAPGTDVLWHSPRPFSAAALVSGGLFVKRHHVLVRSTAQLEDEHQFAAWLSEREIPVPLARQPVRERGDWRYEVLSAAPGADLYRDAISWSPYRSAGHARAAGAALARLHLAARDFPLPAREPAVLMNSAAVVTAPDPAAALTELAATSSFLAERPWLPDSARWLVPLLSAAAPALRSLPSQWGQGDWHPSNLTWTPSGQVAAVFDLGLANRTSAVHDLAVALERSVVAWLEPDRSVDLASARALLDGYQSVRPLSAPERAALPLVLPVCHVEYAISEIEYFTKVTRSPANAALAYDYLIGHARWFTTDTGAALLAWLSERTA